MRFFSILSLLLSTVTYAKPTITVIVPIQNKTWQSASYLAWTHALTQVSGDPSIITHPAVKAQEKHPIQMLAHHQQEQGQLNIQFSVTALHHFLDKIKQPYWPTPHPPLLVCLTDNTPPYLFQLPVEAHLVKQAAIRGQTIIDGFTHSLTHTHTPSCSSIPNKTPFILSGQRTYTSYTWTFHTPTHTVTWQSSQIVAFKKAIDLMHQSLKTSLASKKIALLLTGIHSLYTAKQATAALNKLSVVRDAHIQTIQRDTLQLTLMLEGPIAWFKQSLQGQSHFTLTYPPLITQNILSAHWT